MGCTSKDTFIGETENRISRRLPLYTKLLHVNDSVGLDDLIDQSTHFMLIHCPNLIEPVFVTLFKPFKLILQLFELLGELLVIVSQLDVFSVKVLALTVKLFLHGSKDIFVATLFGLERVDSVIIHFLTLLQHLVIKL